MPSPFRELGVLPANPKPLRNVQRTKLLGEGLYDERGSKRSLGRTLCWTVTSVYLDKVNRWAEYIDQDSRRSDES